jgi:CSLREA domain-containing protein
LFTSPSTSKFKTEKGKKMQKKRTTQICSVLFCLVLSLVSVSLVQAATFIVTKTADTNDGVCDSDCSLREAIGAANTAAGDDVIEFDAAVFAVSQQINLTNGILSVNNFGSLTINGPGARKLTIDSLAAERHFNILGNAVATFNRITFTGNRNRGSGFGGGIYNFFGTVNLNECVLVNNSAQHGGAIYNGHGIVRIANSMLSGNSTTAGGGAILTAGNLTEITNSTISGNTASSNGGGLYNINGGSVNLTNVTIANNSATTGTGGGVDNSDGALTVNVRNSIIADNSALTAPDFRGTLTSQGYNLIENTAGTTISGETTGNTLNMNAHLDPVLRDNGGPTQTHALRVGSPALDKGAAIIGTGSDQRGFSRPFDFSTVPNAPGGDGSDIGAFERQANDIVRNFTPFDFDGDGKSDISIFRPSNGEWWIIRSSNSQTIAGRFGSTGDKPVPSDFTGDGWTDPAFYRPSTGEWFILRSEDASFLSFPFGAANDILAAGDFDADGKADPTVYRPSTNEWFILKSTGGTSITTFGTAGDKPVPADYDGDGKTDIAVFRPSDGSWWYVRSTDGEFRVFGFGVSTDLLGNRDRGFRNNRRSAASQCLRALNTKSLNLRTAQSKRHRLCLLLLLLRQRTERSGTASRSPNDLLSRSWSGRFFPATAPGF